MISSKQALPNEENRKLIVSAREEYLSSDGKNQTLMQEAIRRNMGLVYSIIKQFYHTFKKFGIDSEDAVAIMAEKLFDCILKYDEEKVAFSTFAGKCLTNSVNMIIRKERKKKICKSLESSIKVNDSDEMLMADVVEDKRVPPVDEKTIAKIESERFLQILPIFFSKYDCSIIKMRSKNLTQKQIGKANGISRCYVSKKLSKIGQRLNLIKSFKDVSDIDKFNKEGNFSLEQIKENEACYSFAQYIYSNRNINFDKCFRYVSYDYRQLGMLSKIKKIFGKNEKEILEILAKVENVDFGKIMDKENSGSISVLVNESNLNIRLTNFVHILKDFNKYGDICFGWYSVEDLAFLGKFNEKMKNPINKYFPKLKYKEGYIKASEDIESAKNKVIKRRKALIENDSAMEESVQNLNY